MSALLAFSRTLEPTSTERSRSALLSIALFWPSAAPAPRPTSGTQRAPHRLRPPAPGDLTVQISRRHGRAGRLGLPIALYALGPDGNPGTRERPRRMRRGRGLRRHLERSRHRLPRRRALCERSPSASASPSRRARPTRASKSRSRRPTDQVSGVRIEELRARSTGWATASSSREILRVVKHGERVIQLPGRPGTASILMRPLPKRCEDFSAGATSIGDGLGFRGRAGSFLGAALSRRAARRIPIQPARRRASAVEPSTSDRCARAAERVVIVAGTPGIEVSGDELIASSDVSSDSGQSLASWARGAARRGPALDVALTLPERDRGTPRHDSRADVWLELDDTRLNANVDISSKSTRGRRSPGRPRPRCCTSRSPTGAT